MAENNVVMFIRIIVEKFQKPLNIYIVLKVNKTFFCVSTCVSAYVSYKTSSLVQ